MLIPFLQQGKSRMSMKHALWIIVAVSLFGVGFSGILSYQEIIRQSSSCSMLGQPATIFGYPACVYGLVMYALVAAVAAWGLATRR